MQREQMKPFLNVVYWAQLTWDSYLCIFNYDFLKIELLKNVIKLFLCFKRFKHNGRDISHTEKSIVWYKKEPHIITYYNDTLV